MQKTLTLQHKGLQGSITGVRLSPLHVHSEGALGGHRCTKQLLGEKRGVCQTPAPALTPWYSQQQGQDCRQHLQGQRC